MAMVMLFLRQTTGKTERYTHFCMSLKPVFTRDCGNGVHFMDEPINGLDPAGIIEIRSLLQKLNREKHITILISSHILAELENMATDYAFLSRGKVIQQLSAKRLHELCGTYLEIRVTEPERYTALLEKELHQRDFKVLPDGTIHISGQLEDVTPYSKLAVEQGIGLLALERREMQLEDYYMHLAEDAERR